MTNIAELPQDYDSTLKSLLEDQAASVLSHLVPGVVLVEELNDELLKPPLRADRVYLVHYKGQLHILHIELETGPNSKMAHRLLEYYGILYKKHDLPIIAMVIYPFRTQVVESPLRITSQGEELLVLHFLVLKLWSLDARSYLEERVVSMYPLLPTMQNADASLLLQAVDEMVQLYERTRLTQRLLWMRILLDRTDTVQPADKLKVEERLRMFDSLLEDSTYIKEVKARAAAQAAAQAAAEGEARGEEKGRAEGEILALQRVLTDIVEARFPHLSEIAQQRIPLVKKVDVLRYLAKQVAIAPDEAKVYWILTTLSA